MWEQPVRVRWTCSYSSDDCSGSLSYKKIVRYSDAHSLTPEVQVKSFEVIQLGLLQINCVENKIPGFQVEGDVPDNEQNTVSFQKVVGGNLPSNHPFTRPFFLLPLCCRP